MKHGLSIACLAAVLMLAAAPITLAQTPQPLPPPTAPAPPEARTPETPAPPVRGPTGPTAPMSPAPPPAMTPAPSEGDAGEARACRTFRQVGERCSCLSAPTDFGTSQAPPAGGARNICNVPGA